MAERSTPKLPAEFEVSEPSIEFFKLHLESDVRNRLLKTFGIPLGGGGILAIVVGLFWFLPAKVAEYIQTSEHVTDVIERQTDVFLAKDPAGQGFIRQSVADYFGTADAQHALSQQVTQYLSSNDQGRRLMEAFFATDQGKASVASAVEASLKSDEIRSMITAAAAPAVEQALKSPEFADLVRAATTAAADRAIQSPAFAEMVRASVDQALRPTLGVLSTELQRNAVRTLVEAGDTSIGVSKLPEGAELEKSGPTELDRFISRESSPDRRGPVTMSLQLRDTPYYVATACRTYAVTLGRGLGDRFLGAVIYGRDGRFVALLSPDVLADPRPHADTFWVRLTDGLNANNEADVRALCEAVQKGSTLSLPDVCTLSRALRDPAWLSIPPEARLAVTTAGGKLRGHTTRPMLLAAVASTSP